MQHPVVSREDWLTARRALLAAEKELTHQRDKITRQRLALPWVKVEKEYVFDTLDGPRSLSDLFEGRSQLLVQHFMFGPGWKQGCPSCSFMADHFDGMNLHLAHHDVTMVAISRATLEEIEPFRRRMGWQFTWVSSNGSPFNHDFRVSFTPQEIESGKIDYNFGQWDETGEEWPGISAFVKDESGEVFHTYSTYGRGVEVMMGTYAMLDLAPKGRNETSGMGWLRHHDRYE
ncbi:thioredoxin family protein [Paracoccus caeni]|uniref:Thioredoxin family protein n=1 Tax=Paracoccus caeni TaxID=657651 RepID=A0A934SGS4_9RHOB|nr:thioredoxin family protein [Paracoccus caeni]MBK4214909.1 thioredoxin family protein [Paracoccus caeni]